MKMGLGSETVLRVYHPNAVELYNVCHKLRRVCEDPEGIKVGGGLWELGYFAKMSCFWLFCLRDLFGLHLLLIAVESSHCQSIPFHFIPGRTFP
jgi:hypothetical protein